MWPHSCITSYCILDQYILWKSSCPYLLAHLPELQLWGFTWEKVASHSCITVAWGLLERKFWILTSNHCGEKLPSLVKYDATFPQMKPQSDIAVQTSTQVDKDKKTCKEYIELECNSPKDSR